MGTLRCQKHAAKILAVVIRKKSGIPRPCRLRQFPARQPRCCLHVQVFAHLRQKPLDRRKVSTERGLEKPGAARPIVERRPRRGKKDSTAAILAEHPKLALDLARSQKIVRVQPLDVISLAEAQRMVASRRGALVWRRHDGNLFGGKASRYLSSTDHASHRLRR